MQIIISIEVKDRLHKRDGKVEGLSWLCVEEFIRYIFFSNMDF